MHETLPDHERLQDETVAATGADARRVLELGTGTGETARRMLAAVKSAAARASHYGRQYARRADDQTLPWDLDRDVLR